MKYKKWIIIIFFIIGFFSFYPFSHANQEGRGWSDLPSNHPLKHEKLLMKNEITATILFVSTILI